MLTLFSSVCNAKLIRLPQLFISRVRSLNEVLPQTLAVMLIGLCLGASTTLAQTRAATTTNLSVTSKTGAVTTVDSGTAITLSASVSAAGTALTRGQVNFCDASTKYCADIHILGMAQLTSAGTATLKLRPGIGNHSYKAVFLGTKSYASSSSSASTLAVTGKYPTTTTITQSGTIGNYTLTATVSSSATAAPGPTGQVSLVDLTTDNQVLATGTLGSATVGLTLANPSNSQTGNQPTGIVAGDFNGDGNLDLATGTNSNQTLSVLLGDGTGNFTAAPASSITATGNPVLVQDFNGDGIPDILLSNAEGVASITVLLGNGDGTFRVAPGSPITTGYGSYPVVAADFNGDGIPDLVMGGGYYLVVLLGNGDGSFTQVPVSSSIAQAESIVSPVVGDFNGDGIPDLAMLGLLSNGSISILLGNGDGTFTQGTAIAPTDGLAVGLATADFNGDGKVDLAVAEGSTGGSSVTILLGNGDGSFGTTPGSPIAVESSGNSLAVGDFNGDGIADLFVGAMTNGPTLDILLGAGNGTFSQMSTGSAELPCCYTTLGDFNNDGLTDIASSSFYEGYAQLLVSQLIEAVITESGVNPPGVGTQQVAASYPGDSNFSSSTSGTTSLTPMLPTPQISPTPGTYAPGQTITFTDATQGATIYYNASGIVNTNGYVSYTGPIALTTAGTESIQYYAYDSGDSASAIGTAKYTIALGTAVPTVSVTPSATNATNAQAVTITVAVSGASGQPTPTGSATLSTGSWTSQQALSSGGVTFTVPDGALSAGSNTLTAAYSGDATYAAANGTATITVFPVVSTGQTPSAISPGSTATSTVSFSAGSTYSGTMNVTCVLTSSPSGAQSLPTCSMKPTSVTLAPSGNSVSTLTVETTAGATAQLHPFGAPLRWLGGGGATLATVLLFGLPTRRRRWASMLALLLAIFAFATVGCGGGGNSGGGGGGGGGGGQSAPATTAGNYTFTVTGTDSVNTQITTSATVVVTVQ